VAKQCRTIRIAPTDPTKPVSIFLRLCEPVSHPLDPTALDVVVSYVRFEWRYPGQNFRPLMIHCIIICHIVNDIERVDVVGDVMVGHFGFFVVLKIVEDGVLSNFIRDGEGKRG